MSARIRRRPCAAIAILIALLLPAATSADSSLPPDGGKLEILDRAGNPEARAGVHPDRFIARLIPPTGPGAENGKDLEIAFPPGMGGDPGSVPTCSREVFDSPAGETCPAETQVGTMSFVEATETKVSPIYNLEPAPGQLSAFGADASVLKFKFASFLRPDDLGLTTSVEALPQASFGEPALETVFEFWGVPADHQKGTDLPRRAFLTLPSRCDRGPLTVTIRQRTWQKPSEWSSGTIGTGIPLGGCPELPFAPTVDLAMEKPVADTATGFDLDLGFPAAAGIDDLASAQAKSATIAFPAGMALSFGAAARLGTCSDSQLGLGSDRPAACPRSSRVGSTEITAPQLREPLRGDVYLGEERADERFRLFVVAGSAEAGVETKLAGAMRTDPATGRFTAILEDLPEVAFSHLRMHFDGGPRGLFVTPAKCGPARVDATLTPYSGTAPVRISDSVQIAPPAGRACGEAPPFAPTLDAVLSARRANRPTSFSTTISRGDGEQLSDRFRIAFPPGLSANLGAVEPCPPARIEAAACPAAARIGSAFVEVGTGPETAQLGGNAYFTGPYKHYPFGVALIFSTRIGPFSFGSLAVRAGMEMDPLTGQVAVQTDSMPQSVEGVPVEVRTIGLDIDRPGFMRTPTSCAPRAVTATVSSTEGAIAHPTAEIAVHGCVRLPFRPRLALGLTGPDQLHRDGRPGLRIAMRAKPGEANASSMAMELPAALRFGSGALNALCARRQAMRGRCPAAARVGTGAGRSPLLDEPLRGGIYVVQPRGEGEPDLWTNLRGQGVEMNLRGGSEVVGGRVQTRFQGLPDMPLSAFTMNLAERGVLVLQRDLCRGGRVRRLSAPSVLVGHNGAVRKQRVPLTAPVSCRAG